MPLAEKSLIARIRRQAGVGRGVLKGIGDDCSVLRIPPGHETLVTTDFSLEGVHFRREWHSSESVGHRCLCRGLSDIAAMGGEPVAAFLSLALPHGLAQAWVNGFVDGLLALADSFGVTLAGGDTAQSPDGILADIMVLGSVPRGSAILRSGARPGDKIYVTGSMGRAAFVLSELMGRSALPLRSAAGSSQQKQIPRAKTRRFGMTRGEGASRGEAVKEINDKHFFPEPRVAVGKFLRQKKLASSMIDISDGLSTDLAHLCEESAVGAELHEELIPKDSQVALNLALHGGEDYELLFTASLPIPKRIAGVSITEIGRVIRGKDLFLVDEGQRRRLRPQGWEHFKNS